MSDSKLDASALAALPAFAGLAPAAIDDLTRSAQVRRLAAEAPLFAQGDPARAFFVLLDGRLKVTQVTADGQQVLVRYIAPGEMFGCVAVTGQPHYPGTAIAAVESTVLAWTAAEAGALIERHPKFGARLLGMMGARVQEAHARLRELATERVERRVARALLRLARDAGKRVPGGVEIDLPLSRQDVAEMTGTTLYSVSRIVSAWEAEGIVAVGRRRVVIRKPHALVEIAEDLPARDA